MGHCHHRSMALCFKARHMMTQEDSRPVRATLLPPTIAPTWAPHQVPLTWVLVWKTRVNSSPPATSLRAKIILWSDVTIQPAVSPLAASLVVVGSSAMAVHKHSVFCVCVLTHLCKKKKKVWSALSGCFLLSLSLLMWKHFTQVASEACLCDGALSLRHVEAAMPVVFQQPHPLLIMWLNFRNLIVDWTCTQTDVWLVVLIVSAKFYKVRSRVQLFSGLPGHATFLLEHAGSNGSCLTHAMMRLKRISVSPWLCQKARVTSIHFSGKFLELFSVPKWNWHVT